MRSVADAGVALSLPAQGYAFCEYADDSATDVAIQALNQRKAGNRALTVKRALEGNQSPQVPDEALFGVVPGYGTLPAPGLPGQMPQAGPAGFAGFNVGQAAYPMAGLFPLPMQPTTPPKVAYATGTGPSPGVPGVAAPPPHYGGVPHMPPGGPTSSTQQPTSLPGYDISSSMPWL